MELQLALVPDADGQEEAQKREQFRKEMAAGKHKPGTVAKYKPMEEGFEARDPGYPLPFLLSTSLLPYFIDIEGYAQ